jgi:hypothetical protein
MESEQHKVRTNEARQKEKKIGVFSSRVKKETTLQYKQRKRLPTRLHQKVAAFFRRDLILAFTEGVSSLLF